MIRKVRFNKIDSGLQILQGPMTVKLNNLSAMELNTIRPFFAGALDQFWKLAQVRENGTVDALHHMRCDANCIAMSRMTSCV